MAAPRMLVISSPRYIPEKMARKVFHLGTLFGMYVVKSAADVHQAVENPKIHEMNPKAFPMFSLLFGESWPILTKPVTFNLTMMATYTMKVAIQAKRS